MRSLKCCEIYQNVTQRHEVSKCYWKYGANRLAPCRIATNLQFVKNAISVKRNKSAIKQGMSVRYKISYINSITH